MRLFISGSAPLLAETFADFKQRSDHAILERYGMSETVMLTSTLCAGRRRLAGTVGRALPGVQVRVVDDAGLALAPGEIGNVQVRGPNVFSGYWRMPEKRANSPPTAGSRPATWAAGAAIGRARRAGRLPVHRRTQQGPDHLRRLQASIRKRSRR